MTSSFGTDFAKAASYAKATHIAGPAALVAIDANPGYQEIKFTFFHNPTNPVVVHLPPDYVTNYPNGNASVTIEGRYHFIPATIGGNIQRLVEHVVCLYKDHCLLIAKSVPDGDDGGMSGVVSTSGGGSWIMEPTVEYDGGEMAPGIALDVAASTQVLGRAATVKGQPVFSVADHPESGTATITVLVDCGELLSPLVCKAYDLVHGVPVRIRLKVNRKDYTRSVSSPITVQVDQLQSLPASPPDATEKRNPILGQLRRILECQCYRHVNVEVTGAANLTAFERFVAQGISPQLVEEAVAAIKARMPNRQRPAERNAAIDVDTLDFAELEAEVHRLHARDNNVDKSGDTAGGAAAAAVSTAAKLHPKAPLPANMPLPLKCHATVLTRLTTLSKYCVICDRPHLFTGGGDMLMPSVCSRPTCMFQYEVLGVGKDVVTSLACGPKVIDVLVSFFKAATDTTRWELILNPYPHVVCGTRVVFDPAAKKIDAVRVAGKQIPHMIQMVEDHTGGRQLLQSRGPEVEGLYDWIVSSNKSLIMPLPDSQRIQFMGTPFQFVLLTASPERQESFAAQKAKHGSIWAYHGSRLENWHSILRNGLINASGTKLQVNGTAYGNGIYMSPHASVSFGYSDIPTKDTVNPNWKEPFVGQCTQLRCICIIEVVNHEIKKSGNIWVQPDENRVLTRFFFLYPYHSSFGFNTKLDVEPHHSQRLTDVWNQVSS